MRFALNEDQISFGELLADVLTKLDVPSAARAWGRGDFEPGRAVWSRLSAMGVTAIRTPESLGGLGLGPVETAVAFEQIGRHTVPGPWVESVVLVPALLKGTGFAGLVPTVAQGGAMVSFAVPPVTPRALDGAIADQVFLVDATRLTTGSVGPVRGSVDVTRHLAEVQPAGDVTELAPEVVAGALDEAALATAAMLLGAGGRLLEDSVSYAVVRHQFGRPIGEYQALKHDLADVRVALEFARPLVLGAALSLEQGSPDAARDVAAAKIACAEAAYRASRTALQVHGAIGYTLELDLSLAMLSVRALQSVWGTSTYHRARLLDSLTRS